MYVYLIILMRIENLTDYVTVMFCIAIKGEPKAGKYQIHNIFKS